ncbi:MAG TPA: FCD domain-containing protein, partial [Syntrophorhabdaceae bacterium]|nr:FCD domain-containing protein [Syntrophorhabdaceae bacterium]
MDGISIEELHEARLALEKAILPMIMERIGKSDVEALEANIREVRENVEKGIRGKRNLTFHILLFKASGNQLLIKIGEALFALMDKLLDRYEYSEERSRTVLEEHIALVALLKAGQLKKAQSAIEHHICDTIVTISRTSSSVAGKGSSKDRGYTEERKQIEMQAGEKTEDSHLQSQTRRVSHE